MGETMWVLLEDRITTQDFDPRYGFGVPTFDRLGIATGFTDPVGMDATNGQSIYVAESDRVTLVSEDGRRLLAFAVESIERPVVGAPEARSPGEVAGVAAGPGGTVFVSEATRNVIQVWESGRVIDVIGGINQPRALAVSGRRLYVVDAASGDVRVLDTSGAPLATWETGDLGGAVNVAALGDGILVLGRDGAALMDREGSRLWRVDIESGEPLVAATIHRGWLVVATRRGLTLLGRVPPETP